MSETLSFRIGPCTPDAAVAALLRTATGKPLSAIVSRLKAATPNPER